MSTDIVRLVVVDDDASLRRFVTIAGEIDDRFDVVGAATNATEALDVIARMRPHVVLLDARLGGDDGIELARTLRSKYGDVGVVVWSGLDAARGEALDAGASAFVDKTADLEDVVAAVLGAVTAGARTVS